MANNTKQVIAQAYADLIAKKNIDRVTVKDVAEACGITRQTFYYHFQDLLDVIEWSIRSQTEKIVKQSQQEESMEDMLCTFLTSASQNRYLARKILASQKRYQIDSLIIESVRSWLTELYEKKCGTSVSSDSQTQFSIQFYTYAICGVLLETVMGDETDIRQKAQQIMQLMQSGCSQSPAM